MNLFFIYFFLNFKFLFTTCLYVYRYKGDKLNQKNIFFDYHLLLIIYEKSFIVVNNPTQRAQSIQKNNKTIKECTDKTKDTYKLYNQFEFKNRNNLIK